MRLRIPPGTHGGQRLRIEGAGVPTAAGRRGDLIADLRLVLPSTLDDRSKALMREFGERNGGDVRKDLKL